MRAIILAAAFLFGSALAENFTVESPGSGRVVHGVDVKPGEHPYIVSLSIINPNQFLCGGSILNSQWVLTAAHCLIVPVDNLRVNYGTASLSSNLRKSVDVVLAIAHEQFGKNSDKTHDIAVLKVKNRFWFLPGVVEPVKLPRNEHKLSPNNRKAKVVGWGLDFTGGHLQDSLKEANLTVLSYEDCKARYFGTITPQQICCLSPNGTSLQCNGDSGGPLVNSNRTQIGIVSNSVKPCALNPYPGIYTNVAAYINWIDLKIASAA